MMDHDVMCGGGSCGRRLAHPVCLGAPAGLSGSVSMMAVGAGRDSRQSRGGIAMTRRVSRSVIPLPGLMRVGGSPGKAGRPGWVGRPLPRGQGPGQQSRVWSSPSAMLLQRPDAAGDAEENAEGAQDHPTTIGTGDASAVCFGSLCRDPAYYTTPPPKDMDGRGTDGGRTGDGTDMPWTMNHDTTTARKTKVSTTTIVNVIAIESGDWAAAGEDLRGEHDDH